MPVPEFYNRTETDLKLENVEQRIDHKLDRILIAMESGFRLIDKDMKWMMGGILFLLLGIMGGGGIKWALHP